MSCLTVLLNCRMPKLGSANRTSTPVKSAVDVLGLYQDKENTEPEELSLSTISTQINSLTHFIVSDQAVLRSQVQTAQREAGTAVALPPVALAFYLKGVRIPVRTHAEFDHLLDVCENDSTSLVS